MVPKADQRYSTPGVTGSVPGVVGPLLYNPAAFAAPTGLDLRKRSAQRVEQPLPDYLIGLASYLKR
jgi:hypothetical protein